LRQPGPGRLPVVWGLAVLGLRATTAGAKSKPSSNSNGTKAHDRPAIDWAARAKPFADAFTPTSRTGLAETLWLPETTLTALQLLGEGADWDGREMYTFLEVDGDCNIIGIRRRFKDNGEKKSMPDARPGLTVLDGWDRGGHFFGPEGASDTFACHAMGLTAAGRPNNTGGADELAQFLEDFPLDRRIIILGEWDKKEDGKWPGLDGAKATAANLSAALGRPVDYCLPPDQAKDVRSCAQLPSLDGPLPEREETAAMRRYRSA
jgi:hypothetical protein